MGDGGDELRLGLLRLLDFQGHIIDGVGELPYLVIELFLDLHPIAPVGNEPGGLCNAGQRLHNGADKVEIGEVDQGQDGRPQ